RPEPACRNLGNRRPRLIGSSPAPWRQVCPDRGVPTAAPVNGVSALTKLHYRPGLVILPLGPVYCMDESGIDLRGVIGLLRRQLRLIVGTIVVMVVLAGIVVFSLTPTYTASALVLVDPSTKNLLDPGAEMIGASSENARVDSEVEIIRSAAVMLEVVRANNLVSDPEFGVRLGMLQSVLAF